MKEASSKISYSSLFAWLLIGIGTLVHAGGCMPDANLEEPGSFLDFLFYPIIFFLAPLLFLRFSAKNNPKRFKPPVWLVATAVAASFIFSIYGAFLETYNFFICKEETLKERYANINTFYQKRFDLVPNMATSVKAYTNHENGVIENIVDARRAFSRVGSTNEKVQAINELESTLSEVTLHVENYPSLKSNTLFLKLTQVLQQSEQEIAESKHSYNVEAELFNRYAKSFPYFMIVGEIVKEPTKEYLNAQIDESLKDQSKLLEGL